MKISKWFVYAISLILVIGILSLLALERGKEKMDLAESRKNRIKYENQKMKDESKKRYEYEQELFAKINEQYEVIKTSEYADDDFNKYCKITIRNKSKKTITSFRAAAGITLRLLQEGDTQIYKLNLKPQKTYTFLVPVNSYHPITGCGHDFIKAIRFSDGSSLSSFIPDDMFDMGIRLR